MAFFRQVFDAVAEEFLDVQTDRVYVDAMALFLVQRPHAFDVIVTENMFGDSFPISPSASSTAWAWRPPPISADARAHSSPRTAPRRRSPERASPIPIATIFFVASMLDWLDHVETRRGARLIETAFATVLANPAHRTADLSSNLGTADITRLICQALP